jgi:YVTN family beta-propeller protein
VHVRGYLRWAAAVGSGLAAMCVTAAGAMAAGHGASTSPLRGGRLPPTVAPLAASHARPAFSVARASVPSTSPATTAVGVGTLPTGVAVTNSTAYVANSRSNSLSVVSLGASPAVTSAVPVGRFPDAVALSPDGTRAYVPNLSDGTLSIVDTGTDQVVKTVKVGRDPDGVLQVGTAVYVANLMSGTISVVDPSAGLLTGTITLTGTATPAPSGLAASADGKHLYVDDARNGTTSVIDLTTSPASIVGTVNVGTYPAYLAVHGTTGFVANATKSASTPGTVSVLNLADSAHPAVAHTIAVGSHPYGIALLPALGEALATNSGDGTVSVIDTSSNTVLTTLAVGNTPDAIAVTPDQSTAVVTDEGDNTISIVPVTGWRDLWDQTSGAVADQATNSQNYEAMYSGFDDQAADDFQVTVPAPATGWQLTQVTAKGAYGSFIPAGPASSFNVFIYNDDPSTHLPTTLAFSQQNTAQIADDSTGDVTLPLSPAATLAPGRYWLSVQANQHFGTNGAWYWDDRGPETLSPAVWQQPANRSGLGCTTWAIRDQCLTLSSSSSPDQAFALTGGYVFPTSRPAILHRTASRSAGPAVLGRPEPSPAARRPGALRPTP